MRRRPRRRCSTRRTARQRGRSSSSSSRPASSPRSSTACSSARSPAGRSPSSTSTHGRFAGALDSGAGATPAPGGRRARRGRPAGRRSRRCAARRGTERGRAWVGRSPSARPRCRRRRRVAAFEQPVASPVRASCFSCSPSGLPCRAAAGGVASPRWSHRRRGPGRRGVDLVPWRFAGPGSASASRIRSRPSGPTSRAASSTSTRRTCRSTRASTRRWRARPLRRLRLRARGDPARGGAEAGHGRARAAPRSRLAGDPHRPDAGRRDGRGDSRGRSRRPRRPGSRRMPARCPGRRRRGGGRNPRRLGDRVTARPRALAELESRRRRRAGGRQIRVGRAVPRSPLRASHDRARGPVGRGAAYLRAAVLDDFGTTRGRSGCRGRRTRSSRPPRSAPGEPDTRDRHRGGSGRHAPRRGSIPMRFVSPATPLVGRGRASPRSSGPSARLPVHRLELCPPRARGCSRGRRPATRRRCSTTGCSIVGDSLTAPVRLSWS